MATTQESGGEPPRTRSKKRGPKQPIDYLADRACRSLRQDIYSGAYGPGEHLKEEVLVKKLGASRSVVRQALTQLGAEGLLESRPKIGKFVAELGGKTLVELVPVRAALEQLAVRESILVMDPEFEAGLWGLVRVASWEDVHREIWKRAGNGELEKLLIRLTGRFQIATVLAGPSELDARYRSLVDSMCRRDSIGAERAMTEIIARNYLTPPSDKTSVR